jgi:hypothetical protein
MNRAFVSLRKTYVSLTFLLILAYVLIWSHHGDLRRMSRRAAMVLVSSLRFLCTGDPYYVLYTALLIS